MPSTKRKLNVMMKSAKSGEVKHHKKKREGGQVEADSLVERMTTEVL